MSKYNIYRDFKKVSFEIPFNKMTILFSRIPQKLMWDFTKIKKDVFLEETFVPEENIKFYTFSPKDCSKEMPCLLYFHGGAFAFLAAPYHKKLASIYAKKANCKVILIDYSLIPRKGCQEIEKEAFKMFQYILSHSKELGINKEKIAIAGDSAGGFLTINLVHQIFLLNIQKPCMQMLIYPVVLTKTETASQKKYIDTPRWDSKKNKKMWQYYFENVDRKEIEKKYLENRDFDNIDLKTYIEVCEFDALNVEGLMYADMLNMNNIPVEVNNTKRTIHGYDMNLKSNITKENIEKRIKFLKDNFK